MKKLISILLISSSFTALAAPEQYKNITELMDSYNDYPTYNIDGTDYQSYKVLTYKPLHIQISPRTLSGSTEQDIKNESGKAAIYATFRTLFQTPADSVKVTVIPLSITPQPTKIEYLNAEKFTFSINKKQAINVLRKNSSIVNPDKIMSDNGDWSKSFEQCCYLQAGNPGSSKFAQDLISQR